MRDWLRLAYYVAKAKLRVWRLYWDFRHTILTNAEHIEQVHGPVTLRTKRQLVQDGKATWMWDLLP